MPKLLVVIVSVREGRVGRPVGDWFIGRARAHGEFEVVVADLKELALPMMDEPNHPRAGNYQRDYTKAWSATVAAADAIVFVTPEYNFTVPPPLLNAISYLAKEWEYKAIGAVSYGGISGGTRGAAQLRVPLGAHGAFLVAPAVNIPFVAKQIEDDEFTANDSNDRAAAGLLDELYKVDAALAQLRG